MIFNNPKYVKKIAFSVLIAYGLLFFISIAHHHHIKLNSENSFKVSNNFDIRNHFSTYSEFNCPIHYYYSSLHNILNQDSNFYKISLKEISQNKFCFNLFYKYQLYNSKLFRGPPLVIS